MCNRKNLWRRQRKTRYRAARFQNRTRPKGWLAPSVKNRVLRGTTWTQRLIRWTPITHLVIEHVKFDTQLMADAEISGIEYQQGKLQGYEVRQYLSCDRQTFCGCDFQGLGREWHWGILTSDVPSPICDTAVTRL